MYFLLLFYDQTIGPEKHFNKIKKIYAENKQHAPDSQIDDDDLVSSYEFVLDMVEVEHSDTDRLLQSASL